MKYSMLKLPIQPVLWWWAREFDSESWHGKKPTRKEAIADAIASFFSGPHGDPAAEGFWLASGALRLPSTGIPNSVVQTLLDQVEEDECWLEGCGIDASAAKGSGDSEKLAHVLSIAFEHWLAEHCDLSESRMIEDFRTMNYYRKVDNGDGTFSAELEADRVP